MSVEVSTSTIPVRLVLPQGVELIGQLEAQVTVEIEPVAPQ